jgi:hypothetical protein
MAHPKVLARAVSVAVTVSTAAVATAADEKVLDLSHLGQRQEQANPFEAPESARVADKTSPSA